MAEPLTIKLPEWDLAQLVPPHGFTAAMAKCVRTCTDIRQRFDVPLAEAPAAQIAQLLKAIGDARGDLQRIAAYVRLKFDSGSADENDLDLELALTDAVSDAEEWLRFFPAQWRALSQAQVDDLLAAPELAPFRVYLLALRAGPDDSSPAEVGLSARGDAVAAWLELHQDELASIEVVTDRGAMTLEQAQIELSSADRGERLAVSEAIGTALAGPVGLMARCLDSVVGDRLAVDSVRGNTGARHERDRDNGIEAADVDAMLAAVAASTGTAHRWWLTKADLLALPRLHLADLRAPVDAGLSLPFDDAIELVHGALAAISPDLAVPVRTVVERGTIDAGVRRGKAGNAYCLLPSHVDVPYVLINYGGTARDLLRLAHELGHAVHYSLSATAQPPLVAEAGVVCAELAAFIVEAIVAEYVSQQLGSEAERIALRAARADYAIDAVFRQAAVTAWEARAYATRSEGKRLSSARLGAAWLEETGAYFGDHVTVPDYHQHDWTRISHVFHGRFHNYAYVLSYLCSLAAMRGRLAQAGLRAGTLRDFLSLGGSTSPTEQLAVLGLVLRTAGFWENALSELDALLPAVPIGLNAYRT